METYCVNCKNNTGNKNCTVKRTKQKRSMHLLNWVVFGERKSRFIKSPEVD